MVSQHKIVEELFVVSVLINTSQGAHTFHTLVEHSQAIYIAMVYVEGEIGAEGWGRLAKVAQSPNWVGPSFSLTVTREALAGGKHEDLRASGKLRVRVHK